MRKTAVVTIASEGRDIGKAFFLKELPASQAEKWAVRAFLALAKSGVDIPANIRELGIVGVAVTGLKALGGVSFNEASHLMDEMFSCVQFLPDSSNPELARLLIEDDIEEVQTRWTLRMEVFALHTGFTLADIRSIWALET